MSVVDRSMAEWALGKLHRLPEPDIPRREAPHDLHEQLRCYEERFRILSELAYDFSYECRLDADGTRVCETLSGAYQDITGFTQHELEARGGWESLIHPEDRDRAEQHAARVYGGQQDAGTFRIITRQGTVRWLHHVARPIWDSRQQRVERVVGLVQDQTEQRRAEAARRESDERFRMLFENSPDPVFVEDYQGTVLDVNPAACRLHGLRYDELVGRNVRELVPSDIRDLALVNLARLADGTCESIEGASLRPDGSTVQIEIRANRITYAGQPALLLHVHDISAHKATEQALIEARRRAEEISGLKSSFLNNMSHEIRTPLTAILGFSGILSEEITGEHRELVELIEDSGKRLLNTLNAVLDLSMLEAGTLTLEREGLDAAEVARDQVAAAQSFAREKGIALVFDPAVEELPAYLDRTCVSRVLNHLIDNALKFTDEGCVTVSVAAEDDRVVLRVADTGVGICESFQPYLFRAFRQESTGIARSHVGAGLGLSVVEKMVTLMGGAIRVESQKGVGSTFEVLLPGLVAAPAPTLETPETDTPRQPAAKPRLLAVEDSPEVTLLLQHMLAHDYDLATASDEAGALALARQSTFDMVLMDINLGGARTGVDVLGALREMPGYVAVPVVAMTAYALLEDRERFLEAGFDGYISKPFTMNEIEGVIGQMIAPRRAVAPRAP